MLYRRLRCLTVWDESPPNDGREEITNSPTRTRYCSSCCYRCECRTRHVHGSIGLPFYGRDTRRLYPKRPGAPTAGWIVCIGRPTSDAAVHVSCLALATMTSALQYGVLVGVGSFFASIIWWWLTWDNKTTDPAVKHRFCKFFLTLNLFNGWVGCLYYSLVGGIWDSRRDERFSTTRLRLFSTVVVLVPICPSIWPSLSVDVVW